MPTANVREPVRNVREPLRRNTRDSLRSANTRDSLRAANTRDSLRAANVREPLRSANVRELLCDEVISNKLIAPADADLMILDKLLPFEDADAREHQACLAEPYVTATTRLGCDDL